MVSLLCLASAGWGQTTTLLLTHTALAFSGIEGGPAVSAQAVGVLNMGQGTMAWTAQASTLSGGSWLSVSPTSGTSDGGSATIPRVQVSVSLTGLRAGSYQGLVQVTAAGADKSPQSISVQLTVRSPGSAADPELEPKNLIFAAASGGSSPSAQTLRATVGGSGVVQVRAAALTFDGNPWLSIAPQSAFTVSPTAPADLAVQPQLGSLAPGVYRAALTMNLLDGSSPPTVDVFFLIAPAAGSAGRPCVPTKLVIVLLADVANTKFPVGRPFLLRARVSDDCGNLIPQVDVAGVLSTGSTSFFRALGDGSYELVVLFSSAGVFTLKVLAGGSGLTGETTVQITAAEGPEVDFGGVVDGASFRRGSQPPGTIVSIFGRRLAAVQDQATGLPLPVSLGGARVSVGGRDAPLFYASSGQLNVQLPFELLAGNSTLTVNVGGVVSGPYNLSVGNGFPGIFTLGGTQGAIQIANTTSFAAPAGSVSGASARPVNRGEFITIYCTGLGATQPAVATGHAAPSTPLAAVVTPVRVYFGMNIASTTTIIQSAEASFVGLVPGLVSLYQVNVRVPTNSIVGPAIELAITHAGAQSNTVTLAIQ